MKTLKLSLATALSCKNCNTVIDSAILTGVKDADYQLRYECPSCKAEYSRNVTVGSIQQIPKKQTPQPTTKVYAKVSGVTFSNTDGTKRQDLLKHVEAGDSLTIEDGTLNDKPVTLVRHALGVIGVLRSEYLTEYKALYPNAKPTAKVVRVTGGSDDKTSRGCNIVLEPMAEENGEQPKPRPTTVYLGPDTPPTRLFHVARHCSGLDDTVAVDILHHKEELRGAKACKRCAAKLFPEFA